MEEDEDEETQKLPKEKKQQDQFPPSATKSPIQSRSPLKNHNLEMSSRSSLHSLPPATVSSIPDSHGSSPHTVIPTPSVAKTETPFRVTNGDLMEEKKLGESRRHLRPSFASSTLHETKWGSLIRKALLGFRVTAFLSCLVSFSVMVSDRDKGWARDSFYKYKEFRFCLAANVIGFIYSGFMICDLLYLLSTSIQRSRHNLRHFLEFAFDQMIAYLLASASTSASIRVDDWQSNWGADKFPDLARASVSLSFVSFVSFAFGSLAAGYALKLKTNNVILFCIIVHSKLYP